MILPTKHVAYEQSLIHTGSVVLGALTRPTTVSTLWAAVREQQGLRSFDKYLLTLAFLFAVGAVEIQDDLLVKAEP